jgi:hypothetical protein
VSPIPGIERECLRGALRADRQIGMSGSSPRRKSAHLERILRSYARHYNHHRPHQEVAQELPAPDTRSPQLTTTSSQPVDTHPSRLRRHDRLGGLIHEYDLAA